MPRPFPACIFLIGRTFLENGQHVLNDSSTYVYKGQLDCIHTENDNIAPVFGLFTQTMAENASPLAMGSYHIVAKVHLW
jgi:hypothetical protein